MPPWLTRLVRAAGICPLGSHDRSAPLCAEVRTCGALLAAAPLGYGDFGGKDNDFGHFDEDVLAPYPGASACMRRNPASVVSTPSPLAAKPAFCATSGTFGHFFGRLGRRHFGHFRPLGAAPGFPDRLGVVANPKTDGLRAPGRPTPPVDPVGNPAANGTGTERANEAKDSEGSEKGEGSEGSANGSGGSEEENGSDEGSATVDGAGTNGSAVESLRRRIASLSTEVRHLNSRKSLEEIMYPKPRVSLSRLADTLGEKIARV
eukprot:152793-Prorocentrum_minimum.AAC.1